MRGWPDFDDNRKNWLTIDNCRKYEMTMVRLYNGWDDFR